MQASTEKQILEWKEELDKQTKTRDHAQKVLDESKANISATLKSALKVLEDLQNICESKNPQRIAERITDEDAGVIGAFTLIDFAMIRNTFSKYESDINGDVKKIA